MKWSESHIYTLKEAPSDAEIPSHILMVRGGLIKKLAPGIYTYGPLALRSLRKLENIIREELDKAGCTEILMPMVQPRELWEETNRWQEMGDGLLKFQNRNGHDFCLGATHEEVVTDYARKDIKSYRDLPRTLYQIQTKFRDEIRPRFGLMRGREFLMKDAYSFDESKEKAMESYERLKQAYINIFSRVGVDFRMVKADSGNIGGNLSEEFHVLADSGEDHLLVSESGDYAANAEVCPAKDFETIYSQEKELSLEKFETKGCRTIKELSSFLKCAESSLVKTLFFTGVDMPEANRALKDLKPFAVLLRGSDEVNLIKLKNLLGFANPPQMLSDSEVKELTGASPGSCGPVGLQIPIYADTALETLNNIIVGANQDDYHLRNVNYPRDFKVSQFVDIRVAKEGDKNPVGDGKLRSFRGIEVGHIFYLGTKYSKAMNANFLDNNGKSNPLEMGCYGIGVSRTLQAAIEQNNDKDGMIWVKSIAPYKVHICCLDPGDDTVWNETQRIYSDLESKGIDCLVDDRAERPGVKFKDADLLGMPLRITIGGKGLKNNEIEVTKRSDKETVKLAPEGVVQYVEEFYR
ncbi:MAG: proline--tRNA ligase [Bdellovibrionales bacterium]|nr:proline--tRNA ligase [Bdellovibrionales bacterium]